MSECSVAGVPGWGHPPFWALVPPRLCLATVLLVAGELGPAGAFTSTNKAPNALSGSFLGNLSAASLKRAFPLHKEACVGIIVSLQVWLFHVFLSNTMYLYTLNFRKILYS